MGAGQTPGRGSAGGQRGGRSGAVSPPPAGLLLERDTGYVPLCLNFTLRHNGSLAMIIGQNGTVFGRNLAMIMETARAEGALLMAWAGAPWANVA